VTDSVTNQELTDWGITRKQVTGANARYRFIKGRADGNDWRGPVESRYLQRWVRGPGDESTRTLSREAGDLVITIRRNPALSKTAKLREYIRHGEENNEHKRVYTGQRGKNWFSIEEMERGPIIFPSGSQYGHKVWANPGKRKFTTSPNAYITPNDAEPEVALALLNSTWAYTAALFDAGSVGTEGLVRFGGRGSWRRLHVVDPSRATPEQAADLTDIWSRLARKTVEPFPPEGSEPLSGTRRELDELALRVAGVTDAVEASELVDQLYEWLPKYTEERADVEEMAVAGRQAKGGTARLRNIVEQAFASIDQVPPWLEKVDALWDVRELPDETADTSGQGSLLGFDGHIEQPTDVKFGDEWVRFDTEAQADFVRTLAASRMAPRRLAVPPPEVAPAVTEAVVKFIEDKQHELREALAERVSEQDPSFADAFVQALSRLAAAIRTALHAQNGAG